MPTVTGTWTGAGLSPGGGTYTFTANITENTSTGDISGNAMFQNSPCFSSSNLSGFIIGNGVSVGDQTGPNYQFVVLGLLDSTGTQIRGDYKTGSVCNFDSGTFSMTRSSLSPPPPPPPPPPSVTLSSITVTPSNPNLQVGQTMLLIATGTFSNGTTGSVSNVNWTSSDPNHVTVNSSGLITGIANTTTGVAIMATSGAVGGLTTVTVGQSSTVTVTCDTCSGNTISLSANGGPASIVRFSAMLVNFTGGSETWWSSNPNVISISSDGWATLGGTTGPVTITDTTSSGSGSVQVTVTP